MLRKYIVVLLVIILLLSLTTQAYTLLSIVISALVFYCMIDKFGKGVVLLETMAFYSCLIYLLMPLMGYSLYNRDSRITVLWVRMMPVPFETYYSFILPAITAYILGMFLLNSIGRRMDDGNHIQLLSEKIKQELSAPNKKGIILIVTGLCFYFIKALVPGGLAAVASFGYMLIFPGLLYIYFQPKFTGKTWIYLVVTLFFVRDAINTGMFTVSFYMSITIISFFLVGRKIRFPVKLSAIALAICATFVLQTIKGSFRKSTWKSNYTGSKAELFQDMFLKTAGDFRKIFTPNTFFPIYMRLNQGFTTAKVLRRIPAMQPYDGGTTIAMTVAASVVPRVLWPDKPEAGGVYNMKHFVGYTLKGWSVNIGPIGEAYGNFGPGGAIVYMFFFGLFIGWAYVKVFRIAANMPLLILWIPLLFFEVTYCMENDTLQALNSLLKAAVFLWMLNKLFPDLFAHRKKNNLARTNQNSTDLRNNRSGWSLPG